MDSFSLREPVSALSHGLGMVLALVATRILVQRLQIKRLEYPRTVYRFGKELTLLIFGVCLTFCYGASALFHAVPVPPGSHNVFHRLDHVGIYLLIAGSYTPVAWSMMRGGWRHGTLTVVWAFAVICAGRVWLGGLFPIWMSTLIYLSMGWAALGCYRDLMRRHSQRVLYPLPLGGFFYSVGAVINLSGWPVFVPGIFAAHELFHFFVMAGSACHVHFMISAVVPAEEPKLDDVERLLNVSAVPMPKFLRRRREQLIQEQS